MVALPGKPDRMSVQEYLRWDSGDGFAYELVDGVPRAMAPATGTHALLQNELARRIGNHLLHSRPGCESLTNPGVAPHVLSARNVRIPDLAVTCSPVPPGQAIIDRPVLLVEILSPSNQAKTWSNVWAYTSIPSVREILVLDSAQVAAEVLRRSDADGWPDEPERITEGDLVLASIGFAVPLAELDARTGLL